MQKNYTCNLSLSVDFLPMLTKLANTVKSNVFAMILLG